MKIALGFLVSFSVGAACRYFDIPAPAPGAIFGSLLVMATTLGYVTVEHFMK